MVIEESTIAFDGRQCEAENAIVPAPFESVVVVDGFQRLRKEIRVLNTPGFVVLEIVDDQAETEDVVYVGVSFLASDHICNDVCKERSLFDLLLWQFVPGDQSVCFQIENEYFRRAGCRQRAENVFRAGVDHPEAAAVVDVEPEDGRDASTVARDVPVPRGVRVERR